MCWPLPSGRNSKNQRTHQQQKSDWCNWCSLFSLAWLNRQRGFGELRCKRMEEAEDKGVRGFSGYGKKTIEHASDFVLI